MAAREPELVTIIKRLAELEGAAFLTPSQLQELNSLRSRLAERWPDVSLALGRVPAELLAAT